MKYILNKYKVQETDNATILFMVDNNDNIMLEKCIVLEGTGRIFVDCISKSDNLDSVEKNLLEIFPNEDNIIIRRDLKEFVEKLIDLKLLYWSD